MSRPGRARKTVVPCGYYRDGQPGVAYGCGRPIAVMLEVDAWRDHTRHCCADCTDFVLGHLAGRAAATQVAS